MHSCVKKGSRANGEIPPIPLDLADSIVRDQKVQSRRDGTRKLARPPRRVDRCRTSERLMHSTAWKIHPKHSDEQ